VMAVMQQVDARGEGRKDRGHGRPSQWVQPQAFFPQACQSVCPSPCDALKNTAVFGYWYLLDFESDVLADDNGTPFPFFTDGAKGFGSLVTLRPDNTIEIPCDGVYAIWFAADVHDSQPDVSNNIGVFVNGCLQDGSKTEVVSGALSVLACDGMTPTGLITTNLPGTSSNFVVRELKQGNKVWLSFVPSDAANMEHGGPCNDGENAVLESGNNCYVGASIFILGLGQAAECN
jgi:hypothetical protein